MKPADARPRSGVRRENSLDELSPGIVRLDRRGRARGFRRSRFRGLNGRAGRGGEVGGSAHRHRAAARLVRLWRSDRRLQGEVWPRGQRTQSRRRFGRRSRGDQGQQGQQGPAGARRDRRRPVVRPLRQGRRPAGALQGLDLGDDSRFGQGRRRLLARRLLRRAVLRRERRHREERADRLARPAEARIQGLGRARGRPAHLEPGDDGRLRRRPLERRGGRGQGGRQGPRLLRRPQQEGQFRPRHRQGRLDRPGHDADPRLLGLQRPSPHATT